MARTSKDERSRLIRLGPVPKVVPMEETGGEEDKVEDGASIKHCSKIKPDKAQWDIQPIQKTDGTRQGLNSPAFFLRWMSIYGGLNS
jgi:hypothetical protein